MRCGKFNKTLNSCTPLLQERGLSVQQHHAFICESLSVNGKNLCHVLFLVGDNCSTNQRFATFFNVSLISCNSHKLSLVIDKCIIKHTGLSSALKGLRELMLQMFTLKNSARLYELTHLGALLSNETHWSGKIDMVERCFITDPQLRSIYALDNYLLASAVRKALVNSDQNFKPFISVSVSLQKKYGS